MSRASRAHQRLAVRYFDDRILLTNSSAWAYFRLPTVSYEFVTPEEREALATNITIALAAIRMPDAEVHLRVAHRAYPAAEWAMALNATSDEGPGWRDYLEEMYRHVWAKDFWSKEVYLGVRLGPRGKQLGSGVLAQLFGFYQRTEKALGPRGRPRARRRDRAAGPSRPNGWAGRWPPAPCTPGTPPPSRWRGCSSTRRRAALADAPPSASPKRRWGKGEIESLVEGEIHNGRSLLRIVQPQGDSYVAHLSFARFPDIMPFPDGEPWMHFADQLPFPVEISSRMRLIPPVKASRDVARKLAHARDMDIHIREAGAEAPLALAEQIDAARMLEHGITKERLPFVYGWHRLIVSAPTEDICVQRVEAVVEHYRDMGIDVVNSTGDQFSLFREALPGEKVASTPTPSGSRCGRSRAAWRPPPWTSATGWRTAARAGWARTSARPSAGRAASCTSTRCSRPAATARPPSRSPASRAAARPTLALLMIYQMALRGVTVAVIDPKGDAESLVRAAAEARPQGADHPARLGRAGAAGPVLVRR